MKLHGVESKQCLLGNYTTSPNRSQAKLFMKYIASVNEESQVRFYWQVRLFLQESKNGSKKIQKENGDTLARYSMTQQHELMFALCSLSRKRCDTKRQVQSGEKVWSSGKKHCWTYLEAMALTTDQWQYLPIQNIPWCFTCVEPYVP